MNRTEHLRLAKPEGIEAADIDLLNENADILDAEMVKRVQTVNGEAPDANGAIQIAEVAFAGNLTSDDAQQISGEFLIRTTGGDASLTDGDATLVSIVGRRTSAGKAEESIVMTVTPAARSGEAEAITAAIDRDTFVEYVDASGTITLEYTNAWSANPALYGVTVSGTPINGDEIEIVYVKENRGIITQSNPTAFRSTGWNLYNHANGYAHVIRYSEMYGFKILGTYTSLQFSATLNGERTTLSVSNRNFTLPSGASEGYVWVINGNDTDTAVIMTWSDWTDGYPGDFAAYSETEIDLTAVMTSYFPYGLMQAGGIADEINLNSGYAVSRIGRMAYSAENLAAAAATGRTYEYDTNYIYLVRETPESYAISIDGSFAAYDHGMEIIDGSSVAVYVNTLYGHNLKDKLRTDVVTISAQDLTEAQKEQVRQNIAAYGQKTQQKVMSQIDADGNDDLTTLTSYPTEPGVYRVGSPNTIASGMPSGISGYGALIIYNAGSYRMHLYHDANGCVYSARTTSDAAPTNWKLIGGTETVTSRISITPVLGDGQISNFTAYRSGNMVNISFTLKSATGGGTASNVANLTFSDSTLAPKLTSFNIGASANTIAGGRLLTSGEIYLYCSNSTWTAASGITVGITYLCTG